jgi:hypothetical protein
MVKVDVDAGRGEVFAQVETMSLHASHDIGINTISE